MTFLGLTFWMWTAAAVFAAIAALLFVLLVAGRRFEVEGESGDVTYFSGHPSFRLPCSGYLAVDGEKLVFTPKRGTPPYFSVPIDRVTEANAERHVAGLLGYTHLGPGATLGSNHFLLVNYLDDDVEHHLRFASRVGSARTIELRDSILGARRQAG